MLSDLGLIDLMLDYRSLVEYFPTRLFAILGDPDFQTARKRELTRAIT